MNTEHKDERVIFKAALRITSPTERAVYLKKACRHDIDLLARVEALLTSHAEAGNFLEAPVGDSGATLNKVVDDPGTKIGRYELLERIGEGGMGLVYLAEQKEPVKRRVALKIIKPGMDSKEVITRFEAERQVLALLDHPNIAHVFDAGTTDTGRPYFVMEYVKGMSVTRYCDERKLDIEQRLKLFKDVCEAMHHAHQKGIIHRDLKPSNILISMHGDRAVPKIIDFGIAKAAVSTLTEKTLFTFQGQLLGTPEYMSPEQVDLATQDIDTRADIYSLGVVLYELLAGVLPFEKESLQKIGFAELQHTLREVEPASPSIRLSNLGEEAKAIADRRMTQVIPLARRLHRELEWIPLKAMRKDRCRRYKSASDMADDIQSYLNGNPLLAGPETAMYRVQKFVHKHAGSVTTAALVSVAVIIGLVASIAMAQRAEQARQQEVVARKQVEQALERAERAERLAQEHRRLAEERAEANNLAMAKEAIDKGDFGRVQKLLNACESDLRGWEWQHLNYMSVDPCIKTFRGYEGDVYSIAVSPDGRHIITGSGSDGRHTVSASEVDTVKIWDTATGSEVMAMHGHNDDVQAVALSPDGTRIASGDDEGILKIWDTASGAEVKTLLGHSGMIGVIAFSPDGRRIASSGSERTVRVWDAINGAEVMRLSGHKRGIWGMDYSPDGKFIASGSSDGTIKMWDAQTGAEVRTLTTGRDGVDSIAVSPDGSYIASAEGKSVTIWDTHTGDKGITMHGHTREIIRIAFSPDGKRLASASRDKTIRIWNANTGQEERCLRGHALGVCAVVFSLDGKQIISGSWDNTMKVWDPAIDREVLERYRGTRTGHVAFSPDGKRIAACTESDKIVLIDALSGATIMTFPGHRSQWGSGTKSITFSPDGRRIASGGLDKTIKVWDALTGALEMTLTGHTGFVWSVAFSPDNRRIVSGSRDETIKVWKAATGALERTLTRHKGDVRSVMFSPDGIRIVSGGEDGTVRIWDALSGTELLTFFSHERSVHDVSVSNDGKRIASCGIDRTIRIWDAVTGEELMALRGHESPVNTVTFSPDGRRIVSGADRGEIKIWDAGTGLELIDLYEDPTHVIRSVVFSPDGKSICVGSDASGIILLESVEPAIGHEARRIANSANCLVEELYEKHDLYEDVISKLKDDDTLVESVRGKALQIANARLWEDAAELNRQSWSVIFSTDHNNMEYREALEKLEKAVSLEPNNYKYLAHLAVAQYRVGAYEESLSTWTRNKKVKDDAGIERGPVGNGYRAMALQQLGRDKQADAVMLQARSGYTKGWLSGRYGTFFLECVLEVEKFFAGEDSTLLSIWELIEENKLDEASELIEKARQSKNAETTNGLEGAIKLLEVLRKLK
ncbi:protein kinase [Planctomycetota bacterium]